MIILLLLLLIFPPLLPCAFHGIVTINGVNAPEGTFITMGGDGETVYARTTVFPYEDISVYRINIPGDDPDTPEREGGIESEEIWAKVSDDIQIEETRTWSSGEPSEYWDLVITGGATVTPTIPPPPATVFLPLIMNNYPQVVSGGSSMGDKYEEGT